VKPQSGTTNPVRYEEDQTCENACCPANTCDTAPACTSNSLTGEKEFDGTTKPLAMKSKVVLDIPGNEYPHNYVKGWNSQYAGDRDATTVDKSAPADDVAAVEWDDLKMNQAVFGRDFEGSDAVGPYKKGMLWKLEGMFMINEYHMAVINDNDFGLEGNTDVQIAIIQLKNPIALDACMINPTCSAGAPTGCFASSHVKPPAVGASSSSSSSSSSDCEDKEDGGLDPKVVAEICVYVLSIGLAGFMLYFICGLAAGGSSTTPAAAPEAEAPEVKVVEDPPPMQMMAAPTPAPAPVFAAPPPQPMQQMPGANIGVV